MKDNLTNEQLLLLDQWVNFYKKLPDHKLEKIKKEVKMEFVETTITEHIFNQGMIKGIAEGRQEGEARLRTTALNLLKMGIDIKIIIQATGLSEEEIKDLTLNQPGIRA